jgi:hypothetical protein
MSQQMTLLPDRHVMQSALAAAGTACSLHAPSRRAMTGALPQKSSSVRPGLNYCLAGAQAYGPLAALLPAARHPRHPRAGLRRGLAPLLHYDRRESLLRLLRALAVRGPAAPGAALFPASSYPCLCSASPRPVLSLSHPCARPFPCLCSAFLPMPVLSPFPHAPAPSPHGRQEDAMQGHAVSEVLI